MNRQTAIKTAGVIVIGALGSALWDFSKPALAWLWTITVSISSLGVQSLTDALYAKAAGFALWTSGISYIVQATACVVFLVGAALMQVMSIETSSTYQRSYARGYLLIFMFGVIVMLLQLLRTTYSMSLARDYERLEVVIAPHISDHEQRQFRASLSRVTGQAAFEKLIGDMSSRAIAAGEALPTK